jgi:hypothetical protein
MVRLALLGDGAKRPVARPHLRAQVDAGSVLNLSTPQIQQNTAHESWHKNPLRFPLHLAGLHNLKI